MTGWNTLTAIEELYLIKEKSFEHPQIIFKHSTRCGVSSIVLKRLERYTPVPGTDLYFLDIFRHRNISDKIAGEFNVHHESPQLLLIKNGECCYEESHLGIDAYELADQVAAVK